jgi:hypothetical protein
MSAEVMADEYSAVDAAAAENACKRALIDTQLLAQPQTPPADDESTSAFLDICHDAWPNATDSHSADREEEKKAMKEEAVKKEEADEHSDSWHVKEEKKAVEA